MSGAIYSDAWYRIAEARVSLLPGVRTSRQSYRGQPWVVLEDAFAHRFFRITPEAHAFLLTLHQGVTVDSAWQSYLRAHPQRAPGQECTQLGRRDRRCGRTAKQGGEKKR